MEQNSIQNKNITQLIGYIANREKVASSCNSTPA